MFIHIKADPYQTAHPHQTPNPHQTAPSHTPLYQTDPPHKTALFKISVISITFCDNPLFLFHTFPIKSKPR